MRKIKRGEWKPEEASNEQQAEQRPAEKKEQPAGVLKFHTGYEDGLLDEYAGQPDNGQRESAIPDEFGNTGSAAGIDGGGQSPFDFEDEEEEDDDDRVPARKMTMREWTFWVWKKEEWSAINRRARKAIQACPDYERVFMLEYGRDSFERYFRPLRPGETWPEPEVPAEPESKADAIPAFGASQWQQPADRIWSSYAETRGKSHILMDIQLLLALLPVLEAENAAARMRAPFSRIQTQTLPEKLSERVKRLGYHPEKARLGKWGNWVEYDWATYRIRENQRARWEARVQSREAIITSLRLRALLEAVEELKETDPDFAEKLEQLHSPSCTADWIASQIKRRHLSYFAREYDSAVKKGLTPEEALEKATEKNVERREAILSTRRDFKASDFQEEEALEKEEKLLNGLLRAVKDWDAEHEEDARQLVEKTRQAAEEEDWPELAISLEAAKREVRSLLGLKGLADRFDLSEAEVRKLIVLEEPLDRQPAVWRLRQIPAEKEKAARKRERKALSEAKWKKLDGLGNIKKLADFYRRICSPEGLAAVAVQHYLLNGFPARPMCPAYELLLPGMNAEKGSAFLREALLEHCIDEADEEARANVGLIFRLWITLADFPFLEELSEKVWGKLTETGAFGLFVDAYTVHEKDTISEDFF